MVSIAELKKLRREAAQRDRDEMMPHGISGRWNADGTLTASDEPGTLYVRIGAINLLDKRPATRVLNSEVPTKVNIPVILWMRGGEWDVYGLDSRRARELYGSAMGNYAIPDLAGDLLQFTVPGRNLKPGRVGLWKDVTGKLLVNVGRFDYIDTAGNKKTWIPSDANMLDVFGNRPAAVGGQNQQRWVRFALNPDATSPALVAVNGAAQSTLQPLLSDGYNSIAVTTGYVLLDAVILKTGDTFSILTEDRWEFGRHLFNKITTPTGTLLGFPLIPRIIPDGTTIVIPDGYQAIALGEVEFEGSGQIELQGDAELVILDLDEKPEASEFSTAAVGNIDNLDFNDADVIVMNNETDATLRGLAAGRPGQIVTLISAGAGNVFLAHENAGSTDVNRLKNLATSIDTPLAAGKGTATYQYNSDDARWRMIAHDQGGFIGYTPAWTAVSVNPAIGNGTLTGSYCVIGRNVFVRVALVAGSTTTYGTGAWLFTLPFAATGTVTNMLIAGKELDSSAGVPYLTTAELSTTTTFALLVSATGYTQSNVPFTWATSDLLDVSGIYRIN